MTRKKGIHGEGTKDKERKHEDGRSGWIDGKEKKKGKDQKGADQVGVWEGKVVAIKSWTGPRRRKASVAWVERGPVTSTISRFTELIEGRRGRKRAWASDGGGSDDVGGGGGRCRGRDARGRKKRAKRSRRSCSKPRRPAALIISNGHRCIFCSGPGTVRNNLYPRGQRRACVGVHTRKSEKTTGTARGNRATPPLIVPRRDRTRWLSVHTLLELKIVTGNRES